VQTLSDTNKEIQAQK